MPVGVPGPIVTAVMTSNETGDTIAAVATAGGEGGIAIVRVSGPDSISIADRVYRGKGCPPSGWQGGTFRHGYVRLGNQAERDLDEVVLLVFRGPESYTREDVVEIQGHGGRVAARRILNAVLAAGARPAEPGEFTRRAFLNGRIDLLQAEAVADLIRAQSDRAAAAAVEQLEGRLSNVLSDSYTAMMSAAADLEAGLDFEEGTLPKAFEERPGVEMALVSARLEEVLATWEEGRLLREGAKVVIAGRPNVGKSSLLNVLLGENRAIVSAAPGTTRDTIEESVVIDGVVLRLVDTAGLRDADCDAEREGVERARRSIQGADLTVYVIDGSAPLAAADKEGLGALEPDRVLVVLNKTDLGRKVREEALGGYRTVSCSLLNGNGVDRLRSTLRDRFAVDSSIPPHATISERHRQNVQNSLNALNAARELLEEGCEDHEVLAATELRTAIEALGMVTGRNYTDELLDMVFSRFCVGK